MAVFVILVTIKDSKGKESTSEINVPSTASITSLTFLAVAVAGLIDPLIKGQIVRVGIAWNVPAALSGLKSSPVDGSDVEEGGYFQFGTANGFVTSTRLATFDESKIAADSRLIDTGNSDVAAFLTAMVSGMSVPTVGTIQPQDKRGEDIVVLNEALESFQSSRA